MPVVKSNRKKGTWSRGAIWNRHRDSDQAMEQAWDAMNGLVQSFKLLSNEWHGELGPWKWHHPGLRSQSFITRVARPSDRVPFGDATPKIGRGKIIWHNVLLTSLARAKTPPSRSVLSSSSGSIQILMQPEPGWPETRLLGADFGRYTVSCTTYCFPTALVPYFRSSLITGN